MAGFLLSREAALRLCQAGTEAWGGENENWIDHVTRHWVQQGGSAYAHVPALVNPHPEVTTSPDILLSILIPTLVSRDAEFQRLTAKLFGQIDRHQLHGRVEILSFRDNKQHTVGAKRNQLLDEARGRFVAFIDDDDDVDDEYIPLVCDIIERYPDIDCIGFRGQITWGGQSPEPMVHSLHYSCHETVGFAHGFHVYLRQPNHLNPTRREIAQRYRFPEVNFGEDHARADAMIHDAALREEYFIADRALYFYLYDPQRTATAPPPIS
jgi:hypothetical protein